LNWPAATAVWTMFYCGAVLSAPAGATAATANATAAIDAMVDRIIVLSLFPGVDQSWVDVVGSPSARLRPAANTTMAYTAASPTRP
jgi:hypothetical protein